MAWYAVYRESDGELLSLATAVNSGEVPEGLAFATLDHKPTEDEIWDASLRQYVATYAKEYTDVYGRTQKLRMNRPVTEQDVFDAQFPNFTKLQFRRLLKLDERVAFDNFDASVADEQTKAIVRSIKQDFAAAEYISLVDPLTVEAIGLFVQLGVITPERAAEILNGRIPA